MGYPLSYSKELIAQICQSIERGSGSVKIDGKKCTIVTDVEMDYGKATILFTPLAYEKQRALIQHCEKEVGWHGFVRRSQDDDRTFIVEDIIVYPQEVTGSTITPDQAEYEAWREGLDDEHFNTCLFHGHSHVNMGVTPSGTDTTYQHDVLGGLAKDSFLVFMIWNKRGERWAKIYDKRYNCVFDTGDITVGVTGGDMTAFLKEADCLVKEKKYTQPKTVTPTYKDALPAPKKGGSGASRFPSYYDDDEDDYPHTFMNGYYDTHGVFHYYSDIGGK